MCVCVCGETHSSGSVAEREGETESQRESERGGRTVVFTLRTTLLLHIEFPSSYESRSSTR